MNDAYVWDTETDGLLDTVTRIHVLTITAAATGTTEVYRHNATENTIPQGVARLAALVANGDLLVAHNGTAFDNAVVHKLHGLVIPWQSQRDTMVLARLMWPEVKATDLANHKKVQENKRITKVPFAVPGQMIGRHSLEAWGHRLGLHKGDYKGDPLLVEAYLGDGLTQEEAADAAFVRRWAEWNQAMEDYCVRDVAVTTALWKRMERKQYSPEAILIETQVAHILARQVAYGFLFDQQAAVALYGQLAQRRSELEAETRTVFKPRYLPVGPVFTPKRDNKAQGYSAEAPLTKVTLTEFNPSSRDHVAGWLKAYYGWEPEDFTPDGKAKIDEQVMLQLPYPEAKPLKEYFMVVKRLGQLAEGPEAWLRKVGKDGRMHGSVNGNGAVTGRMTHSGPNMGQVPACYSPWGTECRSLFTAGPGKEMMGADAAALELCDLAGYMARYDGGAYVKTVLEGDKKLGTDMHSVNARALGMDPKAVYFDGESGRDIAKTWFYAFIYGAGDAKLGFIRTRTKGPAAAAAGKADRAAFLSNLPAMGKLVKAVKDIARERGYLIGLDKRHLPVRHQHAALNTLLQAAGAIQMKKALCLFDDSLQSTGLVPGRDYEFTANVHDEWQLEVTAGLGARIGAAATAAIQAAGEYFNFSCPLSGDFKVGRTWADTH